MSGIKNFNLLGIAKKILEWLNVQESWLLIIDNLDRIEVIDGYLSDQSQGQHTLITTRNPYCDHIPVEGPKVNKIDVDDATKLLLIHSKIGAAGETSEAKAEVVEIVKELRYPALAIEQVAGYIPEASGDLFKFLSSYKKDWK